MLNSLPKYTAIQCQFQKVKIEIIAENAFFIIIYFMSNFFPNDVHQHVPGTYGTTTYTFYLKKIKSKHFSLAFLEIPKFVSEKLLRRTLGL